MKIIVSTVVVWMLLLAGFSRPAFSQDYVLGPGDILDISVYGHEELQFKGITVGADGKIAFPLVREVEAGGLTVAQLTGQMTVLLSEFVQRPFVTINIEKYRTTRVYVLGEVTKPGLYEIEKQHNLLDAIGLAGGYTKTAAKKKVFVIHRDTPGQPVKVDFLKLLERGDMKQNVALNDGDVVYLTSNHKIFFPQDLLLYTTIVSQFND
ncbi:MAG TPA: sugar transporter [Firmicutes bacterium]|nr:sugar transporter [Bacillota bacterium]